MLKKEDIVSEEKWGGLRWNFLSTYFFKLVIDVENKLQWAHSAVCNDFKKEKLATPLTKNQFYKISLGKISLRNGKTIFHYNLDLKLDWSNLT